jgi:hypothetical protein
MGQVKSGFLQFYGNLLQVNVMHVSSSRYDVDGIVLIGNFRTTLRFLRDEERYPFVTSCHLFCLPISIVFSESHITIIGFESILLE